LINSRVTASGRIGVHPRSSAAKIRSHPLSIANKQLNQTTLANNRLDHGLLSQTVVLDGESAERLAALSEAFHRCLQPRDEVELAYVESMVLCRWRLMRLWTLESAGMSHEIRRQSQMHESESKSTRAALAFRALSDESHSLEQMNRYETRFDRQFARAHKRLLDLRKRVLPLEPNNSLKTPESAPPEPKNPSAQEPGA
jgi:hypothetical protein